jgi:hypothetical protein
VKTIRIGCGAGYSGDRIEPAVELATKGRLDYLVFECLAERTIALAQQRKARDPSVGYDPLLADRMNAVLPACARQGVKIITNMGAANPAAAAAVVRGVARAHGLHGLKVAAVIGDDVLELMKEREYVVAETNTPLAAIGDALVSANAYVGASGIVEALARGADVIVTGRAADPSLFVAAQAHAFGWPLDDWPLIGSATLVGHLLECGGQVTGGYFADPGYKDVERLACLGFPIAEVSEDGTALITKVPGSGGQVTVATCTEQLLYEITDPAAYVTPDVVADFSAVRFTGIAADAVKVEGGRGRPRPAMLKVALGYRDGFIGEGQISYAGPGAVERGRLALEIVADRMKLTGLAAEEMRYDLIGIDALHGAGMSSGHAQPYEVRLRVAGRTATMAGAQRIGSEVESLYTNGPAGGGGATASTREVLTMASTLMPRELVTCQVSIGAA